MSDYLVAVASGDYVFNFDELVQAAGVRWQGARFFRASGREAAAAYGELQIYSPDTGHADVIAILLAGNQGIGLEGEPEKVAEFMAWLTTRDGFPSDGSVVVLSWRREEFPLNANTSAEALLELPRP